jgi:hypothetical protein
MRPATTTLLVLLLGSNLAWWLLRPDTGAPVRGEVAASTKTPEGAADRESQLMASLARAQARVAELEAAVPRRSTTTPKPAAADLQARRDAAAASAARSKATYERASAWVEAALQTSDPARVAAALAAIRTALQSNDPAQQEAALTALAQLRELDYDKASYRALVLPCLQSPDANVRAASLYALWNTAPDPADLPTILAMVGDPAAAVRERLAHVVRMYRNGALDGEAADAVLKLLTDSERAVRRATLSGLHGSRVDERIEQHCLDLLADREQRQEVMHFALSGFSPKSTRVVTTLIELISDADFEVRSSARHGLQRGVTKADQSAVADAFLKLLETRSDPVTRQDCISMLRSYGSARHVPALEVFAARPAVTAPAKQEIDQLIATLRTR